MPVSLSAMVIVRVREVKRILRDGEGIRKGIKGERTTTSLSIRSLVKRVLGKLGAGDVVRVASISRVWEPWLAEQTGRTGFDAI
jgi:hypothetical protein